MMSKEEIEYIEQIEKAIENNENFYWQEDMYELIEIIKKQHGREQKLIEKLEEDIRDLMNQTKENDLKEKANYKLLYLSKYRKILKGENKCIYLDS